MELFATFALTSPSAPNVYCAQARPDELAVVGTPLAQTGGRSILAVQSGPIFVSGDRVSFSVSGAKLLNLGQTDECVIVVVSSDGPAPLTNTNHQHLHGQLGKGDKAFLDACAVEGLPEEVINLGKNFLSSVREFSDDMLHEGQSRKWVTKPRNFLALTIQNRNQQFCVHVKKSSLLHALEGKLDIRDDRPGYARFWLSNSTQLEAAILAAKSSYGV